MSDYATFPDQTLAPAGIPPHLRMPAPPPPPRRSRATVAAFVAAAILIVGGIVWLLLPREPEPVALGLRFSKGDSLLYRVESTGATTADFRGIGRQVFSEMEGVLKLEVLDVGPAAARARSELTVFSFSANGADLSGGQRIRRSMRLSLDGPILGGAYFTKQGVPLLVLPALSPILPDRQVQPGDRTHDRGVRLFSKKDPRMDGTSRFVGYREVDGARLAVVEGTMTAHFEKDRDLGTGFVSVDMRARIDPATGRVHDAGGTVRIDGVLPNPKVEVVSRLTFRLLPA